MMRLKFVLKVEAAFFFHQITIEETAASYNNNSIFFHTIFVNIPSNNLEYVFG